MTKMSLMLGTEPSRRRLSGTRAGVVGRCALWVVIIASAGIRADQVEMQNGDRYVGEVLSLNADVLVVQSEVLGTVKLPRGRVAHIRLGPVVVASPLPKRSDTNGLSRVPTSAVTNAATAPPATSPQTNLSSNFILRQVQDQFLGDASPEAKAKFNELASGLLSGKLTVSDIRAEAKSAADQLRTLKADLGEDAGLAVDGYLAILDSFLKETKSPGEAATNAPGASLKPKSKPLLKED
jgi:hypothetical protein